MPAPGPAGLTLIPYRICFRPAGWLVRQGWIDPEGLPAKLPAVVVVGYSGPDARAAAGRVARLVRDPRDEVIFIP